MIIIDYDPSLQIPPICEKDINKKIIISIFRESNIFMAIKCAEYLTWIGCSFDNTSIRVIDSNCYTSLINLLINDYMHCNQLVVFYILEDIFDVEFIVNKYNLRKGNLLLLTMLEDRAKEVFREVTI